jgi:hypothetical protein
MRKKDLVGPKILDNTQPSGDKTLPVFERTTDAGKFFFCDRLKMRLVLDGLPVAAPFKTLSFSDGSGAPVQFRFGDVLSVFAQNSGSAS